MKLGLCRAINCFGIIKSFSFNISPVMRGFCTECGIEQKISLR